MSKIEVDAVEPQSGTSLTLGASGDTITIPAGATISNSGTAAGFGPTGAVSWNTTPITADPSPAVSGVGYFANTTSAAFTITLPAAPSAGAVVGVCDYAGTFGTNNLTIDPNGLKISGSTLDVILSTDGIAITLVYVDATQGWIVTDTGSRTETPQTYSVDFLVIAGGGGASNNRSAGGGAGGYRTSTQTVLPGTVITVTVGDGGAGVSNAFGNNGSSSSISGSGLTTITSAGGGAGARYGTTSPNHIGANGGSGGGGGALDGGAAGVGGAGNTPSTAPSQGNNGGDGSTDAATYSSGGGGGGAGGAGADASAGSAGTGGNGTTSSITGSSVTRAGGGGGGAITSSAANGGTGGGGNGSNSVQGTSGTANTGGGAGGGEGGSPSASGGKGVVILSIPTVNYSGTTTGSPTESTSGANKILVFNGDGSYTA